MKVTPLDIRKKEFKRSVRGYSDEEVDLFLDEVADEFERVFQQNVELQDRIRQLEEQAVGNAQLRTALEKTLVSAQLQADQTTANARKESELILRDAELKARGIVGDSYAEVQRVQQALIQLKRLEEDFRFKFRSLLEGHLKLLEEAPIDIAPAQPVVAEPVAVTAATEGTPFVVPTAEVEVPEYPAVAPVARAEAPVPPGGAAVLAAAVASAPAAGASTPAAPGQGTAAETAPVAASLDAIGDEVEESTFPTETEETTTDVGFEAEAQEIWADEPVHEGSSEAETIEQASVFAEFDKAEAASRRDGGEEPTAATIDEDPLSGFFFGGKIEGPDEGFGDGDKGGKSKPRDFEW